MEVRSVESVVKALNGANVQYLIVGGLAVIAHGYERFTNDVDLVIGLDRDNISRGLRAVLALGYQMRIPVTPEQFDNHPGWRWCTAQGARDHALLLGLETTFREKLEWLEQSEDFSLRLQTSRWKEGLPVDPRLLPILEAALGPQPARGKAES